LKILIRGIFDLVFKGYNENNIFYGKKVNKNINNGKYFKNIRIISKAFYSIIFLKNN